MTQIKEKDQDIFADITNSHSETTFCDQIDSFKQLIDLQLTELTILTARYNDFKTVLTAIKAFEQHILTLQDYLESLEDGNPTSFSQLDSGLDQLIVNYDQANNTILNLLNSDTNFCTFVRMFKFPWF